MAVSGADVEYIYLKVKVSKDHEDVQMKNLESETAALRKTMSNIKTFLTKSHFKNHINVLPVRPLGESVKNLIAFAYKDIPTEKATVSKEDDLSNIKI